jgi:hypothetical protein
VDYLGNVFDEQNKWCKKINIPMICLMVKNAIAQNIDVEDFAEWFNDFFSKYTPECEYAQFCSTGSIKKEKTLGRTRVMTNHYNDFFKAYHQA